MVVYYFSERLYLLKSIQYLVLAGTGEAPISAQCSRAVSKLLADGFEAKMLSSLKGNLTGGLDGHSGSSNGGPSSGALVPTAGGNSSGVLKHCLPGSHARCLQCSSRIAAGAPVLEPPDLPVACLSSRPAVRVPLDL